MIFECPGSQKFKHPQPEVIKCPYCGADAEIWTDEVQAECQNCKKTVVREKGQSCLDWCASAKECIGEKQYERYMKKKKGGERNESHD